MRINRNKLLFAVGLALGTIFLWLAVREVDLREALHSITQANFYFLIPFIVSLFLFYVLKAARWATILEPSGSLRIGTVAPAMMIGFGGNNVLPMRLGELARILVAGRDMSLPKSQILATLIVERIFDVVSILLLLTCGSAIAGPDTPAFEATSMFLLIVTVSSLLLAWAIAFTPQWLSSLALRVLGLLPVPIQLVIRPRFRRLHRGFDVLRHGGGLVLRLLGNSILQWLLLAICIYCSFLAFDLSVEPVVAILVLGLLVAGISLPSAPGYVGTIEMCFVIGLEFFGVPPTQALSAALFYHLLTFVLVTTTAAFFLHRIGYSWSDLKKETETVKTTDV